MDVYLKKRFDLIPNLVETVKGYAKHEAETLSSIIGKRSHDYAGMTQEEKISTGASISQMMPKILALAEAYPDLKACSLNAWKKISQIHVNIIMVP